jgi:hypothetical protein
MSKRIDPSPEQDKIEKRLNIVLPMRTVTRIEKLKEATLAASTTEVIKSAILTYEALVENMAEGNKFYICKSGDDRFHPVNFIFDVQPKRAVVQAN